MHIHIHIHKAIYKQICSYGVILTLYPIPNPNPVPAPTPPVNIQNPLKFIPPFSENGVGRCGHEIYWLLIAVWEGESVLTI